MNVILHFEKMKNNGKPIDWNTYLSLLENKVVRACTKYPPGDVYKPLMDWILEGLVILTHGDHRSHIDHVRNWLDRLPGLHESYRREYPNSDAPAFSLHPSEFFPLCGWQRG